MRRRDKANDDALRPPKGRLTCLIEDWVSQDEIFAHSFDVTCGPCGRAHGAANLSPGDCHFSVGRLAIDRHKRYRRSWLAEHGIPDIGGTIRRAEEAWPSPSHPLWSGPRSAYLHAMNADTDYFCSYAEVAGA